LIGRSEEGVCEDLREHRSGRKPIGVLRNDWVSRVWVSTEGKRKDRKGMGEGKKRNWVSGRGKVGRKPTVTRPPCRLEKKESIVLEGKGGGNFLCKQKGKKKGSVKGRSCTGAANI